MTTPKEAYELRKKARQDYAAAIDSREETKDMAIMDMVDRFVTAVERIAVAAERGAI